MVALLLLLPLWQWRYRRRDVVMAALRLLP
jgi:hypothetical protein